MSSGELDAEIIIGGVSYEQHLIRLERDESLSAPGGEIRLMMSENFPHTSISPWDTLVVYEQGVKTMTGYVSEIMPKRTPALVELKGQDQYKRAREWFMPENVFTDGTQNVGYWVNYVCNECGLGYVIHDTTGSAIVLNPDIPFGMRYVADVLVNLSAIAQWQMQVDADGVLHFRHISRPTSPDYDFPNVEDYEFERNDIDTRNSVKVWGFQSSGSNGGGGSILYSDSRVVEGISDTRNMVYAEPNIITNAQAQSVGTAALDQWAKIEELLAFNGIGNPNIRVGDSLRVYSGLTSGSYLDTITEMRSTLDSNGYNQSITAGRRAYRFPYWPITTGAEAGTPTIVWEYEGVIGEAMNLWMVPNRNMLFVGGWTRVSQATYGNRCWRLECLNLSTGSLVWGQDITDVATSGSAAMCQINGVYADSSGVYVTGYDTNSTRWRTERYNLTGGSSTWSYTESGAGGDIAGNGTYLYVTSKDTEFNNLFPSTQPSVLRKLDYSGSLVTAVTPVRDTFDPPYNGAIFNGRLNVYNFNHINLKSDGLYLGGLMQVGTLFSYTYFRYVCKYDLDLSRVWENGFIPGEGEGDIGGSPSGGATPTGANSITSVVLASGGPVYGFTRLNDIDPSPHNTRGIWYLTLGGGYTGISGVVGAVNAVEGNGYKLFIITKGNSDANHQGLSIIGFNKSTQTVGWTLTPGPGYNGIRYLNYANRLFVCGQKNGNFYVAGYNI